MGSSSQTSCHGAQLWMSPTCAMRPHQEDVVGGGAAQLPGYGDAAFAFSLISPSPSPRLFPKLSYRFCIAGSPFCTNLLLFWAYSAALAAIVGRIPVGEEFVPRLPVRKSASGACWWTNFGSFLVSELVGRIPVHRMPEKSLFAREFPAIVGVFGRIPLLVARAERAGD